MSDTLKLALVGCGAICRFHLDGIKESAPRIQVTAAIDTDGAITCWGYWGTVSSRAP